MKIGIGHNLKKIRAWKGMGQKEVSNLSGVPQGTISRIESGSDFLFSKVEKICDALEITIEDMICFQQDKVSFTMTGNQANGMIIHHHEEKHLKEMLQQLKDENLYLRRMLEKALSKEPEIMRSTSKKLKSK